MGSHRDVHILRTGKALIFRLPTPRLALGIERLLDSHDFPTRRAVTEVHAHKKLFSNRILSGVLLFSPLSGLSNAGCWKGRVRSISSSSKSTKYFGQVTLMAPGPKLS